MYHYPAVATKFLPALSVYTPLARNRLVTRSSGGARRKLALVVLVVLCIRRRSTPILQRLVRWLFQRLRLSPSLSPSLVPTNTIPEQIELVLHYWFGRFPPDTAQKQLWMCTATKRELVDADIVQQFQPLLLELVTTNATSWCCTQCGWRGKLAAIVVLDQMSRHILRYYHTTTSTTTQQLPTQEHMDQLAYQIAQEFHHTHVTEIQSGMIPIPMVIFSLLPHRHQSSVTSVAQVQSNIERIAVLHSKDLQNMISRFRTATNRRMAVLQDTARRVGSTTAATDVSSGDYSNDDILQVPAFLSNMENACNHVVVVNMMDYLTSRGIHPNNTKDTTTKVPFIVSLSGGVDSMVIASILCYLRDTCHYSQLYLVAVHVNYGNRPESTAEATYVQQYSNTTLKFDSCLVTEITNVTRGTTAREEYETTSRKLRYDLYRTARTNCIHACNNHNHNKDCTDVPVFLGHHKGDLVENVLSNLHKGNGPLDLSGMTSVGTNDGVTLFRPFLSLEKKQIYDYAHKYGVPYFKDTTPHWSTRGKVRTKLLPLLEEIYGDGCTLHLWSLAKESDEARILFNKSLFQSFMDKVSHHPMGIIFHVAPFKDQGPYFWKVILRQVLHNAGLGMFSDKTVANFLQRVVPKGDKKVKPGWLQCRKDYAVYLNTDQRVFIFYPQSFPWRKSDHYNDSIGRVIQCGTDTISIGPWLISTERVNSVSQSDQAIKLLEKKAMESWDQLMEGYIEYTVTVPLRSLQETDDLKLVIVKDFTQRSRPMAWKNTDLKVQATLPILGNDTESLSRLSVMEESQHNNPHCVALVKVVLRLRK